VLRKLAVLYSKHVEDVHRLTTSATRNLPPGEQHHAVTLRHDRNGFRSLEIGGLDRMFRAYDAATGAELWSKRLNDVPASVPIAYSVNGQDYIATVEGPAGSQSSAYVGLVPELQNPPDHGATLWVFEVPKGARSSR
jgi:PQQ enzyme repeat